MRRTSLILCLTLLSGACHKSQDGYTTGVLTGTVGCGSIVIQVGPQLTLQPTNLGDFSSTVTIKTGQKVLFSYTIVPDEASICMVGPIITLKSIRND